MSTVETWTIGRLLEWTSEYFQRHASSTPRLDAEVLLAEALECQRIDLYARYRDAVEEPARSAFRELVRRRAAGEPVAYLVGHREFYSLSFEVTRDVLIPRPETELLVLQLLEFANDRPAPPLIADVGTGSGIIAVCAAKQLPNCRVTAIDTSPAALRVAEANAARHGVSERIQFLEGDLLTGLSSERFDIIASNPPYVSRPEFEALSDEVKRFEPQMALLGGETGGEIIERLIPQAAERLVAGGALLIEISPMIEDQVLTRLASEPAFDSPCVHRDLSGHPRVVFARRDG